MLMELQRPNIGLAGFALSFSTLLTLEKNGILADHEAIEIVNQALEILRTQGLGTISKVMKPGNGLASCLRSSGRFCRRRIIATSI